MKFFCWPPFSLRFLSPAKFLWLIFLGAFLIYTQEAYASQGSCDGVEKTYHVSDSGRNSVWSAVSVNPESEFLSSKGKAARPPLFYYVGTNREFLKKANHKLLFNNSRNTLLSSGPPVIPLLAIKGILHPGATQMGLSLLSLLHMPFFQSGRFGRVQR